jgi:SRSO17 transposase
MNADTYAMRASLETQAARKKQGSAADRAALAAFARQQRSQFAMLQGNWSRHALNARVQQAIHNMLSRMTRARRLHVAKGAK